MRGENLSRRHSTYASMGSSPHARGKLTCSESAYVRAGLIPACAGKTLIFHIRNDVTKAHPRMRGENGLANMDKFSKSGSSPHARGKHLVWYFLGTRRGLIPACAGKTDTLGAFRARQWAHPRMRGENSSVPCGRGQAQGSSPHARGKLVALPAYDDARGLIPACAGKTPWRCCSSSARTAHPRMRGENSRRRCHR